MNRYLSLMALSVVILFCIGADGGCDEKKSQPTAITEMQDLETNQKKLIAAVPVPQISTSLERKNIARRLQEINKEDAISYIYLIDSGKVIAYYTVRGKVSSLNSYMTSMEQVVEVEKKKIPGGTTGQSEIVVLEAPDSDGSYGKNPDGIFFYTTEGARIEWDGKFLWSTQPLKVSQQPELIEIINK